MIGRHLLRIPYEILEIITKSCEYSDKDITKVAKAYCRALVLGFSPYFVSNQDAIKFDLFLDFIVLLFANKNVNEILKQLLNSGSITKKKFISLLNQRSKLVSKKSFQEYFKNNLCFHYIVKKILRNFDDFDFKEENKNDIETILKDFTSDI